MGGVTRERIMSAINQGFCTEYQPSPKYDRLFLVFIDNGQYSVVFKGNAMRATRIDNKKLYNYCEIVNEFTEGS